MATLNKREGVCELPSLFFLEFFSQDYLPI